jgi:hypothetical protein
MFLDFIFIFVVGWLFTNFANIAVLLLNKPKYLNYVCRKCFTFWFGFIFLLISTQDVKYSIAVAGIASFISFIINEKLDV